MPAGVLADHILGTLWSRQLSVSVLISPVDSGNSLLCLLNVLQSFWVGLYDGPHSPQTLDANPHTSSTVHPKAFDAACILF